MAIIDMEAAWAASAGTARLAGRLLTALAALRARAARRRAEDEWRRLPERTLADLGLRRTDLAPGGRRKRG